MIHLTLNQISAYIDAELPEASVELVRLHLSSCLECTQRFGYIEEQEEALSRLLQNDPGDTFFQGFADRVVPAPKKEPAPVKKEPMKAAKEPAAEPKVAKPEPKAAKPEPKAAKPEPKAAKPEPKVVPPTREKADPRREAPQRVEARAAATPAPKPERRQGSAARVLIPAAAVLLIISAVAVIVARPRALTSWMKHPASAPNHPSPAATTAPPNGAASPPAPPASDLLERAAAATTEADGAGTAEAYDAAANAWEAALPQLQDDADELTAGRRELASARYAAWAKAPTPERRNTATKAVRAYLLAAPAGADRDRAWTWLAALKR